MIFVIYNEQLNAYKFMLNVNGVLSAVTEYNLVGVIEGNKNDLKTIKQIFKPSDGWVAASDNVKKFIFNRKTSIPVTVAIYKDRMFISLRSITNLKKYLYNELYYDVNTLFIEYNLPVTELVKMANNLQKFHIKHSVYQLNEESKQVLADLEPFKNA